MPTNTPSEFKHKNPNKDYSRIFNKVDDAIRYLTFGPEWTASHFKILGVLQTRLNSRVDHDFRVEKMYLDEFADKYINPQDTKKDIRRCYKDLKEFEGVYSSCKVRVPLTSRKPLIQRVIKEIQADGSGLVSKKALEDNSEEGFYSIVVLDSFGYVPASKSDDGRAYITFSFNPKLKPCFLQIDGRQNSYTEFMIDHLNRFCSKYAYKLYELLKADLIHGFRTWPVDKLREKLSIEGKYTTFGEFKKFVLTPAINDICAFSDIFLYVKEVKARTKVVAVDFSIFENTIYLKQVPDSQKVQDVKPITSGFKTSEDVVLTLKERFDERLQIRFDRAFKRFPKAKRQEMINAFLEKLSPFHREKYDPEKFPNTPLFAVFRQEFKDQLIKQKRVWDFESFAKECGYEVVQNKDGKFKLKHPVLTEE
ncbi:replication initiation protein [Pseudodesulfovibrio pelocollis]|uniref:replication initiation protein n=1 Tax=Pseudodesulfovibrio pelocollis TaxID=3051432 RepID=UPI00255B30DD|nr:replication initiation protein [Pseudodesulfovibrio sp. SB368]